MNLSISFRLMALCAFLSVCAQAGPATPKPARAPAKDGNRFLLVVETSSAMLSFEHAGRQAVFDLVYSGISNQAQPGDTLGLWNFGEQPHGGVFPMQVWETNQNLSLASIVGLFLKNQHYDKEARLERVLPKLLSLVRAVKDVNILIVSAPNHVWKGTPFDAEINAAFQKQAGDSLLEKRPLVTVLVARNGALVSWSAVAAGETITLPRITKEKTLQPPSPPALVASIKPANSNAVRSIVITSKKAEMDEPQEPGTVRITVTKKEPVAVESEAATNDKPSLDVKGNNALASGASASESASSGPKPRLSTSLADSAQPPETSGRPASRSGPQRFPFGVLPVAAREKPGIGALATPSPPETFLTARNMLWLGIALAAGALGLCYVMWRQFRATPRPSFITQSFERER